MYESEYIASCNINLLKESFVYKHKNIIRYSSSIPTAYLKLRLCTYGKTKRRSSFVDFQTLCIFLHGWKIISSRDVKERHCPNYIKARAMTLFIYFYLFFRPERMTSIGFNNQSSVEYRYKICSCPESHYACKTQANNSHAILRFIPLSRQINIKSERKRWSHFVQWPWKCGSRMLEIPGADEKNLP